MWHINITLHHFACPVAPAELVPQVDVFLSKVFELGSALRLLNRDIHLQQKPQPGPAPFLWEGQQLPWVLSSPAFEVRSEARRPLAQQASQVELPAFP